ncbi:response regulator [Yersinia sp. 2545 StPb PI]|uniref:response regulator n=1 Tax=unclassified Yersinia (in: enterobacteria) TaxID=2653513 RepID=UPI003FA471F3
MSPHTLLVIDDDEEIRSLLTEYFTKANFRVLSLPDGEHLLTTLKQESVDLVILDVMLPGDDGFTLCRKARQVSAVPIIMLTAASDESDKVIGLELGADDYLAKPFSARELLARVKALLRRNQIVQSPGIEARFLCFNGWKLDLVRRELIDPQKQSEPLSGIEFTLLSLFLRHPNQILDRDQISEITRRRENNPLERGIDVQISRLRQRLQDSQRLLLRTLRNQGYMLCCDVTREY